ncbi:outer membrane beta-barrel protein [Rhizobium sp. L1K21]|uniref:outer membrane beta-barrel protein n=1 Tax=Rhizobium sp. L1K21 TaxID=2954933 RepID=UPI0020937749|nr:outer membrane beta-barrel protein [Rhizobium sp. L1K21]MCO6185032.1 outer membrane beta-barrel protein [Rhizobium sp. L1K21]
MTKTGLVACSLASLVFVSGANPHVAQAQTIFADPAAGGLPPDQLQSDFGGGAPATDDAFSSASPDQSQITGNGDPAISDDTLTASEGRLNPAASKVDAGRTGSIGDDEAPGIRLGTAVFRPSLRQSLGHERTQTGQTKTSRTYSETELKGTLTSDWLRHQLRLEGSGLIQKNIAGTGSEDPRLNLNAELRLDVSRNTTATLDGGYNFQRESSTDPNSLSGASTQSPVHTFNAGISVEHDIGRLKGTLSADGLRSVYGDAKFSNGTTVSRSDRDANTGTLALRLGYQISPVLTPFVEGSISRTYYDQKTDSSGYARDSAGWKIRAGLEADFGEKLKGEISGGYEKMRYADARLDAISALSVDGSLTWSPQRGTDITLGTSTSIKPSTTAGTSGYVLRTFSASVSQEVTRRLVARLTGGVGFNDYDSASNSTDSRSITAGAGLTWKVSRYLDVTGDTTWQYDRYTSGAGYHAMTFMAGVTLKR